MKKIPFLTRQIALICILAGLSNAAHAKPNNNILYANLGGGCNIGVENLYNGKLSSDMPLLATYWTDARPTHTNAGKFYVRFECKDLTISPIEEISRQYGARYDDSLSDEWITYYPSKKDEIALRDFTQIHTLNSKNAKGFYITQDDISGDPKFRLISLSYCLFHEKVAVCGTWPLARLHDAQRDILLHNSLNILRSVIFLDPQPTQSGK